MSSSGVPGSGQLIQSARTYRSIQAFLAATVGGISLAITYLFIAPTRSLASGIGTFIDDMFTEITAFMASLPNGLALINRSGARASAGAVSQEGLIGFILAMVIMAVVLYVFTRTFDYLDFDIPFLNIDLPDFGSFGIGPEDEPEDEEN